MFMKKAQQNEKLTFYFSEQVANKFRKWAYAVAITSIVIGAMTLPLGIVMIICGIKLYDVTMNIKNSIATKSDAFSEMAGESIASYFKTMYVCTLLGIILLVGYVLLVIILSIMLIVGFSDVPQVFPPGDPGDFFPDTGGMEM